ncbi:MAG: molybdopterin-binding/glycosyltransferase family 2 protein [Myxococcota bacterium]
MRFGSVPVGEISGAVLAHTHRLPSGVKKKGRVLSDADVDDFRAAGFETVIVATLDPDDLNEDDVAARVAAALLGSDAPGGPSGSAPKRSRGFARGIRTGDAHTGRVNFFTERAGLFRVEAAMVDALNLVDERITFATLPNDTVVQAGDLVATVKVIPFAVPDTVTTKAVEASAPCIEVQPISRRRVGLILTRLAAFPETLLDRAEGAQRSRVERLGGNVVQCRRVPHEEEAVTEALGSVLGHADVVLLMGASAIVDRADVLPSAVRAAGGEVRHLGMPVDPGNLLMLAERGEVPIIGVPSCARSTKPSGFDRVLRRVMAGVEVRGIDIMRMGTGGLLKEVLARPMPRTGEPAPMNRHRIGAMVLAAGSSRRMGDRNKLLQPIDGVPMVRRVVDTVAAANVDPIVVVTGHDTEAIEHALASSNANVTFVPNPHFADGMSTSLRAGAEALSGRVDGAFVALGDMPFIQAAHLRALQKAFDPAGGTLLVIPTRGRQQGHPVLFAERFLREMHALEGDRGAKRLLQEHADVAVEVPIDDEGIVLDLDTPELLEAAQKRPPKV